MARLGKHDSNSCTTVVVLLVPVPVTELVSASVATGAVEAVVGGTVCEGVAVREKEVPGDVTGPPATVDTVDTVDTAGESAGVGVGTAVEAVEDEPKEKPEVVVGAAAVPAVPVEGAGCAAAKLNPAM